MKRITSVSIVLICVVILFTCPMSGMAYERGGHDALLKEVLFKGFKEIDNDIRVKSDIEALCSASYLTIDQFNHNGQGDLDYLKSYGVKNLPELSEIDFTASGKTHRDKTHRGWNHSYPTFDRERWAIRQDILRNTVEAVFDFDGDEAKKESFCKLLYYIHILGDHLDNQSLEQKNNNGKIIAAGGTIDKNNLIDEFLILIEFLFRDQKHTHKYRSLTTKLEKINRKFAKVERSKGGVDSDYKFYKHQKYVRKTYKILTLYIPEMLKDEKFFHDVFY